LKSLDGLEKPENLDICLFTVQRTSLKEMIFRI